MRKLRIRAATVLASLAGYLLAVVMPVHAATNTWSTTGTTVNWNLAGNWSGGLPISSSTLTFGTDSAVGTTAGHVLNNDMTGLTIAGITFSAGAPGYTLGGNDITTTANITNSSTSLQTINLNIASTAVRTFTLTAGGGNITLNGNYTGTGAGIITASNGTLTLAGTNVYTGNTTVGTNTTLTITGSVSGSVITVGAASATLNANATNALTGNTGLAIANTLAVVNLGFANNYNGATTLSSGTVNIGNAGAFGNSTVAANGATLIATTDLTGANAIGNTFTFGGNSVVQGSNSIELSGPVTLTGTRTLTNNLTSGTLTLGAVNLSNSASNFTLTVAGSANTTISGSIGNGTGGSTASALSYQGSGILTLTAANNYGGATNIGTSSLAGTLRLSSNGTLGSGAVTIASGTLDINNLTRSFSSTLTLGGGPATGTATLAIGATGTLTLGGTVTYSSTNNNNGASITGGTLNLGAPRTFNVGDSSNAINDLTVSATIGDGNGIFDVTKSGNGTMLYTPNITLSSPQTSTVSAGTLVLSGVVSGGNGIFDVTKAGAGILSYTPNIALGANQTTNVTAGITSLDGIISGTGFGVTTGGSGVTRFTNVNTYNGATTVSAGTLSLYGATASVNSAVTVNSGGILLLDSSLAGVTGASRVPSVALAGGGLAVSGNSSNSADTVTGNLTIDPGNGISTVTVTPGSGNAQLAVNGNLVRNSGGVVLFRGTALGANTIASATAGTTNISIGGTVSTAGGTGTNTTDRSIILGAIGDTTLAGVGFGATGGLVTYDATRGVRLLDYATEYTAAISDGQTQLDNVRYASISGTAVTTTLTSSLTTINSLSFANTAAAGTTGVTVTGASGQTLKINSGTIYANFNNLTGTIAAGDSFTVSVPTLDLNGKEGLVLVSTGGSSSGGNFPAKMFIGSAITNAAGLTKAGPGQLVLNGSTSNTFTGTVTVNQGVLSLNKTSSAVAIAGDLVLNGGSLFQSSNQYASTTNITINGGTYYHVNSNNTGGGIVTFTANNFTMNGGTLGFASAAGGTTNLNGTLIVNGASHVLGSRQKVNVAGLATLTDGGTLSVNTSSNATNTYERVLTLNGGLTINNTASGAYNPVTINWGSGANINGGQVVLGGGALTFVGNGTNTNTATIVSVAGSGNVGTLAVNGTRTFDIGNGAAAVDLAIETPLINGTSAGGLAKTGLGTLGLSGANTYTGGTTVSQGKVVVSAASTLGTGNVLVTGSGTILELDGNAAIADGATLTINTGSVVNLDFSNLITENVGLLVLNGTSYNTGVFDSTTPGGFFSGTGTLTVVPEPGSLAGIAIGAGMLLRRRRARS